MGLPSYTYKCPMYAPCIALAQAVIKRLQQNLSLRNNPTLLQFILRYSHSLSRENSSGLRVKIKAYKIIMAVEQWFFRSNAGDWVFDTSKRCFVSLYSREFREWEKIWGKAAPCPVDENGNTDIAAITEELQARDKKCRQDVAKAHAEAPCHNAAGHVPIISNITLEDYAIERRRRMACGVEGSLGVRTKG